MVSKRDRGATMIDTDKYEGHTPAPWSFRGPQGLELENETHSVVGLYDDPRLRIGGVADMQLIADAPLLLEEVRQLRWKLFWLTDSMDDDQRNDTDKLKERAVHPSIADFVQRLAEWGFNNCDNGYVWEAMCAVIEAGERGDLDDLIGCYDDDEADEYFKLKEANI